MLCAAALQTSSLPQNASRKSLISAALRENLTTLSFLSLRRKDAEGNDSIRAT